MFNTLKKLFGKNTNQIHYLLNDCENVCNSCEEEYLGKGKTCKGCDKKICKHCYYTEDKVLCKTCDAEYIIQMKYMF